MCHLHSAHTFHPHLPSAPACRAVSTRTGREDAASHRHKHVRKYLLAKQPDILLAVDEVATVSNALKDVTKLGANLQSPLKAERESDSARMDQLAASHDTLAASDDRLLDSHTRVMLRGAAGAKAFSEGRLKDVMLSALEASYLKPNPGAAPASSHTALPSVLSGSSPSSMAASAGAVPLARRSASSTALGGSGTGMSGGFDTNRLVDSDAGVLPTASPTGSGGAAATPASPAAGSTLSATDPAGSRHAPLQA